MEIYKHIRGIGLTNWVSKQLERYVLNWIWPFVQPHIDPDQMGGVPGCSIEHYIVKMLHFILTSLIILSTTPSTLIALLTKSFELIFLRLGERMILISLVVTILHLSIVTISSRFNS